MKSGIFLWFGEKRSEKSLWSTVGRQCSGNSEDQSCRKGSLVERDGMSCITLSQSGDQTPDHPQQAERIPGTVPPKSPRRRSMVVSSNAWCSPERDQTSSTNNGPLKRVTDSSVQPSSTNSASERAIRRSRSSKASSFGNNVLSWETSWS